jgi:hypothetical protein
MYFHSNSQSVGVKTDDIYIHQSFGLIGIFGLFGVIGVFGLIGLFGLIILTKHF